MKLLAVDTSTYVMGAALTENSRPAAEYITHVKKNHSIRLMPAVRSIMQETGWKPGDLDAIAAAEGPGSYTGVRIGVTTAKSMAWALGIPVIGVSSLEVLAFNGRYTGGVISPFFDARRGQVFTGLYRWEDGRLVQLKEDRIIPHGEWLDEIRSLGEPVTALSPDLEKHEDLLQEKLGQLFKPAVPQDHLPRPSSLACLAADREGTAAHLFSPNYLRLAEAEAKWQEKQKEQQHERK
ncbi:MAG: tRNA (adenosine(37)-N6)-threonylcarbamoyltransferase complex dimerization subunit type 1 TsaB [Alkalicoccus sp.]|nr:MAG: tRNA (adenosine(37)-N6)-threonylcarbamoyltransferase complex dimerization subunit type 1 TsaB [Alkalicoccus sp.]